MTYNGVLEKYKFEEEHMEILSNIIEVASHSKGGSTQSWKSSTRG